MSHTDDSTVSDLDLANVQGGSLAGVHRFLNSRAGLATGLITLGTGMLTYSATVCEDPNHADNMMNRFLCDRSTSQPIAK